MDTHLTVPQSLLWHKAAMIAELQLQVCSGLHQLEWFVTHIILGGGMLHRLVCKADRVNLWERVRVAGWLTAANTMLLSRELCCWERPSKVHLCKISESHKASSNCKATEITILFCQYKSTQVWWGSALPIITSRQNMYDSLMPAMYDDYSIKANCCLWHTWLQIYQ